MKKHLIYLLVIAGLLVVISFNRCGSNPGVITERSRIDSIVVDSLQKEIQRLKNQPIPDPDTVEVFVEVPAEPDTSFQDEQGNQVNEYRTFYADSSVSIVTTTGLTGTLKYQKHTYAILQQTVVKETVTKYLTQYRTTTRTVTKQRGGFLAIGGQLGFDESASLLTPVSLEIHAKDGYTYRYTHIPQLKAHLVGISIPIRIKIPFL